MAIKQFQSVARKAVSSFQGQSGQKRKQTTEFEAGKQADVGQHTLNVINFIQWYSALLTNSNEI